MNGQPKSRWLSRGYVGSVVAAACAVAVIFGVPDLAGLLGFESQAALTDTIVKVTGAVGAALGAFGRLKAKSPLK